MEPDFWHERWQANMIGFHQGETNSLLQQFWPRLELAREGRILVPLCGKSLDMLWLREQGYRIVGIEVSPIAVEAFFDENSLSPEVHQERYGQRYVHDGLELLCADLFSLSREDIGEVSAFYDRAALIALAPAQRPDYAIHLNRLINRRCGGLLVTLEYDQQGMSGPPFSVGREEVCNLFDSTFTIEHLSQSDALEGNQRFRDKGLTKLTEHAFHLTPSNS